MEDPDDVIVGARADAWHEVIGLYGDPLRMILINPLVAKGLNHFGGEAGRERIAKPQRLVHESIHALVADRFDAQFSSLVKTHEDFGGLANSFPALAGTRLLDLGSGNGYLGGWLASLGVQYTGVEPSADLNRVAAADPRLKGATLIEDTIRHFCETDAFPHAEPPTLISIIGVVDHLGDPRGSFRSLFDFLERRDWLNVPLLVAGFDPDFFLPELPIEAVMLETSAPYGIEETLRVRDPAVWEELFVDTGFHILEQRPLHISSLPMPVSHFLHGLHARQFDSQAHEPLGGSALETAQPAKARVPPRQGPFYFWLLSPRNGVLERLEMSTAVGAIPAPSQTERFEEEEALSVVGNLSTRVYRVVEGDAFFESPETGRMPFHENALFGQLEASSNYVSSRVLGTLRACRGSKLEIVQSREILRYLAKSTRYPDMLFLSLLRHLESVQFVPFVSAKRSDERQSAVLTGTIYNWRLVRNIAACLLQASANAMPSPFADRFRSRILVDLPEEAICRFVYGPVFAREGGRLIEILPALVQANVIDSFSAYLLERSGAELNLGEIGDVSKDTFSPLHIGWQVARFIDFHFPKPDAEGLGDDIYPLALAIAAFFGSSAARKTFKSEFSQQNSSETRNKDLTRVRGRAATRSQPRTDEQRCDYALSLVSCPPEEHERLRSFLTVLRVAFDFNDKSSFAKLHGLSRFIVVRDVWALLACLLDRKDMWDSQRRVVEATSYISRDDQKPRIVAYLQECIAHAGRQTGFESCPW